MARTRTTKQKNPVSPDTNADGEQRRLAALHALKILDTPPEERFDRITRLAATLFDVPIVLISLVDENRQWFKSRYGLALAELARESSICTHAIEDGQPLLISDARADPRFATNPLVVGEPHIRFYAGCPLSLPQGVRLGALCLIDHVPRELSPQALAALRDLAALVEEELCQRDLAQVSVDLIESEARYRSLFEQALDGIMLVERGTGRILLANQALVDMLGHTAAGITTLSLYDLVAHETAEIAANLERCFTGGRAPTGERNYRRTDGGIVKVEVSSSVLRYRGREAICVIVRDLSERKAAQSALHEIESLSRSLFENSLDGILILGAEERVKTANPAACRLLGYAADGLSGLALLDVFDINDRHTRDALARPLDRGPVRDEIVGVRGSGERFPAEVSLATVVDREGAHNLSVILRDVTRRRRDEEQLRFLAQHDPLTGLPNRELFREQLELALSRARRFKRVVGVLFLDLDLFKVVNDSLGHPTGDRLLRGVADRLREAVRKSDVVARLGGDEFVVILDQLTRPEDAAAAAQKLLDALSLPYHVGASQLHATASIGISCFPRDGGDSETLVRKADVAMYQVKESGRNGFHFFAAAMNERARNTQSLLDKLRTALANDELSLAYQPKFRVRDGRMTGVEALLRWHNPTLGHVAPGDFIALAEQAGLMDTIGIWVLETACRELARLHALGHPGLGLAVNLSARQFRRPDLGESVAATLAKTGIAPRHLTLELTESTVMQRPDEAALTLHALRESGVQIALDDFGTGYSSLNYLRRFTIDHLKIDSAFVRDITLNEDGAAITRSIIALAHALRIAVTAEGVETAAQAAFLKAQGCDEMQGYFFSRPLAAQALARLLQAGATVDTRFDGDS